MPIYEITCNDCHFDGEALALSASQQPVCPNCGSPHIEKKMAATSSLTGKIAQAVPGPKDTTCCGSQPGAGSCTGPGSCCGGQGI